LTSQVIDKLTIANSIICAGIPPYKRLTGKWEDLSWLRPGSIGENLLGSPTIAFFHLSPKPFLSLSVKGVS
jgi:hypothetical protein